MLLALYLIHLYNGKHKDTPYIFQNLLGILCYPHNSLVSKINAQNIRYDSSRNVWKLIDYTERELLPEGERFSRGGFKEMEFPVRPIDFAADFVKVDEKNYRELNELIRQEKLRGGELASFYRFERLQRFLHPLLAIILTLMGLALSSAKTRHGMGKNLAIGIALAFTFILFLQMSRAFAVSAVMPVWAAAFLPIVLYGIVTGFLLRFAQK